MAQLLYRLGRWSFQRKWWVLSTWVLIFAILGGVAGFFYKPFTSQFSISNTPSIEATHMLMEKFPEINNPVTAASVTMVFKAPEGEKLTDSANREAMDKTVSFLQDKLDGQFTDIVRFGDPVEVNEKLTGQIHQLYGSYGLPDASAEKDAETVRTLSSDETIGFTSFTLDAGESPVVSTDQRKIINEAMDLGRSAGLQVEAGGQGFGAPIEIEPMSEIIGLGIAFLVLLFTFGSLVASGLPLLTAIIGVGIGVLSIVFTTHFVDLNNVTPTLAVMIGLAVGIDYSLFVLSRYRAERQHRSNAEAAGVAVGTAGSAVVFAGITVIVALAALSVAGIGFLSAMGLLAALTVFITVLVTLTFTPALLGAVGDKVFSGRVPFLAHNQRKGKRRISRPTLGSHWVRFVHKIPGTAIAIVLVALGTLSLPIQRLEMALPNDTTSEIGTTQRQAADLLTEGFGAGINAPLLMVIDAKDANPHAPALAPYMSAQEAKAKAGNQPFDEEQAARFSSFLYTVDSLDGMSTIKNAQLSGVNNDSTAAQILITPNTGPADPATMKISHTIRDRQEEIEQATGVKLGTTGLTAVQLDITEELSKAMPIYLGIVVGLAIILLLIIFRSLLIPVVAGLGFLLSVGAAFGTTVLFWQEGLWGLVPTPAPLVSFIPIFLIGVTFGLAMDYQVFLVTRMREQWIESHGVASGESRYNAVEESIIFGFTRAARVVTAAAIIMIAVFVAFIGQPLPFIKVFGFALAAGVLFDAFFIRMTLVPASMFLLGRATWWMPRWLDRILPHFDVEGSSLEKFLADKTHETSAKKR
ncbi:MMPL family transporter [Corynebacterium sp. 3HC-13]|uniref:MMPL family transporter n=1 Tax=Corynebacterium poyangense TaxID=2684405 RepID=UPI001CCE877F|nr:MMPL family transporter [Corynebacterium poyangense]MBZ8177482.1 MMPL family transporter [Corynebacterium poyangense]